MEGFAEKGSIYRGSAWQKAGRDLGPRRGHGSHQLRPCPSQGSDLETFPLSRKCCFLPVTQPWPGNLRRTGPPAIVSASRARPPAPPWCLGDGSQRRRRGCRLGSRRSASAPRHPTPRPWQVDGPRGEVGELGTAQTSESPSPC